MKNLVVTLLLIAFPAFILTSNGQTVSNRNVLDSCFGDKRSITIARQMPYLSIKMGHAEGNFVLDFGSNITSIDPAGFKNGVKPTPKNDGEMVYETPYFFDEFDFFGRKGDVKLLARKTTVGNLGFEQAGIIGTDFFMEFVFALDYANKMFYRSSKQNFCKDISLLKAGFKPVSTEGYYADQFSRLLDPNTTINVPTVPIKIGAAKAVAQIDPGYDDSIYPHTVNVNRAFFDTIKSNGVVLTAVPDVELTTCTGSEKGTAYRLGPGYNFEIIGMDRKPVLIEHNAFIIVKESSIAQGCGGIGTWSIPAAQIGASFLVDSKQIIFDPFSSKVWFKSSLSNISSQTAPASGVPRIKLGQQLAPTSKLINVNKVKAKSTKK